MADTDNYGFGRYPAPEELVTPATIAKGTLPTGLVPTRPTRDEGQDKRDAYDVVLGTLMGMGMPLLSQKGIEVGARLLGFEEDEETYREEVLLPWLEEQRTFKEEQKRWEEGQDEAQIFADPRAPGMMELDMEAPLPPPREAPQKPSPLRPRKTIYETAAPRGRVPIGDLERGYLSEDLDLSPLELWEMKRARRLTDLTQPPIARKPTLKKGAQAAADVASVPAGFALKTPAGATAYAKALRDRKTAGATVRAAQIKAQTDRDEARGAMEADLLKEERKEVRFNGAIQHPQRGLIQISRNGVFIGGRGYISSRGDPSIDVLTIGGETIVVPEGQLYPNDLLTAGMGTEARKTPVTANYVDLNNPQNILRGTLYLDYDKDGNEVPRVVLHNTPANWPGGGGDLDITKAPPDTNYIYETQNAWEARTIPKDTQPDVVTEWEKYLFSERAAYQTVYLGNQVVDLLEKDPAALTTTAGIMNFVKTIEANIQAATHSIKGHDGELEARGFKDIFSPETGNRAYALKAVVDEFAANPNDPNARRRFLEKLDEFRRSAKRQFADGGLSVEGWDGRGEDNWLGIENITEMAADHAILVATQLRMAYMAAAAAGQTSRTLSDKDLAHFLKIVGYGTGESAEVIIPQLLTHLKNVFVDFDATNPKTKRFQDKAGALDTYLRGTILVDKDRMAQGKTTEEGSEPVREAVRERISRATVGNLSPYVDWVEVKNEAGEVTGWKLVFTTFEERMRGNDFLNPIFDKWKKWNIKLGGELDTPATPELEGFDPEDVQSLNFGEVDLRGVRGQQGRAR